MDINAMRKIQLDSENQSHKLKQMLTEYDEAKKIYSDMVEFSPYCGHMEFVGTSGKTDGYSVPILSININAIGGCKRVPELIRELAMKKIKEMEAEFEKL